MSADILVLLIVFIGMLVLNAPVAVAIGVSAMAMIATLGSVPTAFLVGERMTNGINSFPLLAIPFFVLSGILMGEGGMARRLMDFAAVLVGRLPGGLAYVNTLSCMLFGAVSGSAAAAVSSIGGFMIPQMIQKGYSREFAVALTATSATTGLLIPPSNIMIVYAVVASGVSVAGLFLAGVFPGILVGLLLMVASFVLMRRPANRAAFEQTVTDLPGFVPAFVGALPSMLLIILVLGGILGGIFSPTEASAISVAYAYVFGGLVYREVRASDVPGVLLKAAKTTSVVMLLIGASQSMSWVLTYQDIPQTVSAALLGFSDNPIMVLLLINVLLLIVGTFMDMTPAVLIFTPIFLPAVIKLGVDPVHFGIIMIANLCIGLCTPPVGTCLFVGCSVGKTTLARVVPSAIPFFIAMAVALMFITYVPALSLWLPRQFGL
jgi:tripartite ATP-independent transporter DctM subunit